MSYDRYSHKHVLHLESCAKKRLKHLEGEIIEARARVKEITIYLENKAVKESKLDK